MLKKPAYSENLSTRKKLANKEMFWINVHITIKLEYNNFTILEVLIINNRTSNTYFINTSLINNLFVFVLPE